MAANDIVAISDVLTYVTLDDLHLSSTISAGCRRILRLWDARKVNKDGKFMGIMLLLLDEKVQFPEPFKHIFTPYILKKFHTNSLSPFFHRFQ